MNSIIINLPLNINIYIWEKKKINKKLIYLTNNKKKFKFFIDRENFFLDKWCNSIVIKNYNLNVQCLKFNNFIKKFFKSWDSYFFKKIKFKGKGFRIKFYKKIKLIKFYFGKSHKTFFLINNLKNKKISKYKFMLLSIDNDKLNLLSKKITKIKNINVYTLRGLRLSRQIILKRKGKKGTYI